MVLSSQGEEKMFLKELHQNEFQTRVVVEKNLMAERLRLYQIYPEDYDRSQ